MTVTFDRQYTTGDKSGWGDGPWQSEPDKTQWVDETTGLDCLIVRNHLGGLCGYVGVPPEHPWHGLGYGDCTLRSCPIEEIDYDKMGEAIGRTVPEFMRVCKPYCDHTPEHIIDVHGGITFASACSETADESTGICHVPLPGRPHDVWWFGFDCGHCNDIQPGQVARYRMEGLDDLYADAQYRTIGYVVTEVRDLARQLAAAR